MPYNIDDDVEQKNEDGKAIIKENSCKTAMAFFCLLAILLFLLGIIVFLLYSTEPFSTNLVSGLLFYFSRRNPERRSQTCFHLVSKIFIQRINRPLMFSTPFLYIDTSKFYGVFPFP